MALWSSAEAFQAAASQPEFRERDNPFRFHAALYEVIRES